MNDQINYKNNPLHGVSLKNMLVALVDHYGFEILFAYLNIHCFKTNPSIASSVKFLKKTDWAREKVENFYLYQFKGLPRASREQFELSPRDRIVPDDHIVGEPAELSLEDARRLQMKRAKRAAANSPGAGSRSGSGRGQSARSKPSSANRDRKAPRDTQPASAEDGTGAAPTKLNPWSRSGRK
jgi:uncharacterized protein (DUF2132 family)